MESATLRPARPLTGLAGVALIGLLLALAATAWVLTGDRMSGMDDGPGTALGGLGWFAVTWLLMMAAMMLPSLAPAALAFGRAGERTVAAFVVGYLAAWTIAGVVSYLLFEEARSLDLGFAAWDRTGRYLAAGVLLAAAAYQLTTAKSACLGRCRSPLTLVVEEGAGVGGGLRGGVRHGGSCVGCCVGLMAALFALGVMSITWMVVIAALIAAERLAPWRRTAVYGLAAILVAGALWMAVAPGTLPGLTIPGSMEMM
jgi:predicted metal-binding membrane protein